MKDLKSVLAEKEAEFKRADLEFRRVSQEVTALRMALKLCDDSPKDVQAASAPEVAKEAKGWP